MPLLRTVQHFLDNFVNYFKPFNAPKMNRLFLIFKQFCKSIRYRNFGLEI